MSRGKHLIGKVLGSYVLERLLGYGGSSAVFLAQQQKPERKVAIKVFLPRSNLDAKMQRDFYKRFLREAESASKLDHPNILPVYSYGEQDGLPYIVMPFMEGGTLSEYMTTHGEVSLLEAQWFLAQIASALDYAHAHGCVHCDVKPANILLDSDGRVMLSDFGIARVMQVDGGVMQAPTSDPETLMGTPDYISPEQALGLEVDGRSDVYSLGITLFYLLAKRLPFIAESTIALALLQVHESPPSLALIRADISPSLDRVVRKALAKEPEKRFQTASAFSVSFAQAVPMSDKVQAVTATGKRAAILAASSDFVPRASQPILVAFEPRIEVKPIWASSFAKPRSVLMMFLALFLLLAAGSLAFLMTTRFAHGVPAHVTKTALVVPDLAHVDRLIDTNKWPGSKTFFYDNQLPYYHIRNNSAENVALALYGSNQFDRFRLTISMSELRNAGDEADYYGVVFRSTVDQSHYYLFEVLTKGQGQYAFSRFDNGQWSTIMAGAAPSLLSGLKHNNTIIIDALDKNTFAFSINGQLLAGSVRDLMSPPLPSGLVGLYVEEQGAEVAFSHLYIVPHA